MCITCYCPPEKRLTKETLKICFNNNNDGAGFAFNQDDKLIVEKGFFNFNELWNALKQIPKDSSLVIHCRKVTHGPKDKKNCHPWRIDENHAFTHNGTIKQFDSDDKDEKLSDTGKFVSQILRPMFKANPDQWRDSWAKELIEDYIGDKNKCIIISN